MVESEKKIYPLSKKEQFRSTLFSILRKFQPITHREDIKKIIRVLEGYYSFTFHNLNPYPISQKQLLTLISKLVRTRNFRLYFNFIEKLIEEER